MHSVEYTRQAVKALAAMPANTQMTEVQVIVQGGKPAFYVVPAALWMKISGRPEDIADAQAFDRAVAADNGVRFPEEVAHAMADGVHAVRAWREHCGLSQDTLAAAAGVSKPFVSQIESGKRAGSASTLKKLAVALGVTIDALTV